MSTPNETIPSRLFKQAERRPDAPAHQIKSGGVYRPKSYRELADEVKRLGKAMIALGQAPGFTVCLLGFNRSEWVAFNVAAMAAGGAPAGIYTTCSPEEVAYIVHHAESQIVLVEDAGQWAKIEKMLGELPHLKHVVTMRGAPRIDHPIVSSYEQFLDKGKDVTDEAFFARIAALEPQGLATLIYTSGTTGPPKGVMLSHQNLAWTADTAQRLVGGTAQDCVLSYLPLSHIAEQMFTIHGCITMGGSAYFAESIEKVPDNLKEVQPTLFFGVPRIWEKFHAGVQGKLKGAQGAKKALVTWAMDIAREATAVKMRGGEPSGALGLQYKLAQKLVFAKLKAAIGLSRARTCVCGAAPVSKEILAFFASLDILVSEVYGQSEDTGPTTFNLANDMKLGAVGTRIEGIDVRIAEDGEILVKGPNVFLGYYKEAQATADTLQDGWLHSGDLGQFDKDGFLSITGRKKEIIITAGGKNIAPKNIEAALKNHPPIAEAVVIGDRRKFLTALVVIDPAAAGEIAGAPGADPSKLRDDPTVVAAVQQAVDRVNATLARVETVKKFHILDRPFTIERGELTPTLKLKRRVVYDNYASEIDGMYEGAQDA
ncbi:AMP-dependent synthetase/ligase [Polyangium sorediatum]|uniref:Long-chain fatty acid--CoA ligase n=1 Tax=Polyangium sorediatum TaxID=889274 RepID=A0ABT6P3G4_9BACT|nr:long-chain fatty acid--CoA ligase [Polyangium sorediatum]MDI1435149.1 long-chain fatty acid--CoA ligase [Polyangium sorediatum]